MENKEQKSDLEQERKDKLEVAEQEFARFAEAWEIDTIVETMSDDDAESFEGQKRKVLNKIVLGRAVVTEAGDIVYQLRKPIAGIDELTLSLPSGRAWLDMDKGKKDKFMSKSAHMIASAVGQPVTFLSRLSGIDFKFIQDVYALFLAS